MAQKELKSMCRGKMCKNILFMAFAFATNKTITSMHEWPYRTIANHLVTEQGLQCQTLWPDTHTVQRVREGIAVPKNSAGDPMLPVEGEVLPRKQGLSTAHVARDGFIIWERREMS
jgi:hypothetical protein